jgi:hypothetical protein
MFQETYQSSLQGQAVPRRRSRKRKRRRRRPVRLFKTEIGCPETSIQNYHSTLCKIPEECRSQG